MPKNGYDYFDASSGTRDEMICRMCSEVCEVRRRVTGPASMATTMAKKFVEHDVFICKQSDEAWH